MKTHFKCSKQSELNEYNSSTCTPLTPNKNSKNI